jgi:hypothetical protein
MKRILLICLSLVLALVSWSAVCAEDGFYVIPSIKVVPRTGQTTPYAAGDDGALQKGVAWPTPRFTDNGNGTITDNLTQLIWMKDANAFGVRTWDQALSEANGLKNGQHGLTDGSNQGDWRLPNLRELQSLIDYSQHGPALPVNHPFIISGWTEYWSSTTNSEYPTSAWFVYLNDGYVDFYDQAGLTDKTTSLHYVWCVRGGR